jgi:predicted nucleic acid-binding protein
VGLTRAVKNDRFYLDANTVIAIVERNSAFTTSQRHFLEGIDEGRINAVSSDIAMSECLVRPIRDANRNAIQSFLEFFDDRPTLPLIGMSRDVMIKAAELRALTLAKLPDAIHIACALLAGCTVFLSADQRLHLPKTMRRVAFDDLTIS